MSTRVLLVGQGLFQDSLQHVLQGHAEQVELIGTTASWEEAKQLLLSAHPDTIVADYRYADAIVADIEALAASGGESVRLLFLIPDENKLIVYQRQQLTDITIDNFVRAL